MVKVQRFCSHLNQLSSHDLYKIIERFNDHSQDRHIFRLVRAPFLEKFRREPKPEQSGIQLGTETTKIHWRLEANAIFFHLREVGKRHFSRTRANVIFPVFSSWRNAKIAQYQIVRPAGANQRFLDSVRSAPIPAMNNIPATPKSPSTRLPSAASANGTSQDCGLFQLVLYLDRKLQA